MVEWWGEGRLVASEDKEATPGRADLARLHLQNVLRYGISQRQFASLTGIPRSTLGDFLRGTHQPTEATLSRIEAEIYPEDYDPGE